ncbi:hypothetical protein D4R78_03020 [bacterium]|nr:MAG: hypothetical protein D4R78_03020 [bacterium]
MFLGRKGQTTAEYAILIGLVVAVAAGILQVALKGGIRKKNKQALDYMLTAGNNQLPAGTGDIDIYTQEYRKTDIFKEGFQDKTVMQKGGFEGRKQQQKTLTESVEVESKQAVTE